MRIDETTIGPWTLGLENFSDSRVSPVALREAHNIHYSREGIVKGNKELEETGDVDFRGEDTYIKANIIYHRQYSSPVADGPYQMVTHNGLSLLSHSEGYIVLTDYGIIHLPTSRPVATFTELNTGHLRGCTQVIVVQDGLASIPFTTEEKSVLVNAAPGSHVYATHTEGHIFYYAGVVQPTGDYHLTRPGDGTPLPDTVLEAYPLRPGADHIALLDGRAVISIGSVIHYSEPFMFGAVHVFNSIALPEQVTMLGSVGSMLFAGTPSGVYNIQGLGSDNSTIKKKASIRVFDSNSLKLDAARYFSTEADGEVCIWPTEAGIQIGTQEGVVLTPKAGKLNLSAPTRGVLSLIDDVIYYFPRRN